MVVGGSKVPTDTKTQVKVVFVEYRTSLLVVFPGFPKVDFTSSKEKETPRLFEVRSGGSESVFGGLETFQEKIVRLSGVRPTDLRLYGR